MWCIWTNEPSDYWTMTTYDTYSGLRYDIILIINSMGKKKTSGEELGLKVKTKQKKYKQVLHRLQDRWSTTLIYSEHNYFNNYLRSERVYIVWRRKRHNNRRVIASRGFRLDISQTSSGNRYNCWRAAGLWIMRGALTSVTFRWHFHIWTRGFLERSIYKVHARIENDCVMWINVNQIFSKPNWSKCPYRDTSKTIAIK